MPELPKHLGGHLNYTNNDTGVLDLIIQRKRPKSFFDIGCGPGGMIQEAQKRGLEASGCDGDFTLDFSGMDVEVHDFTKGPLYPSQIYDLGWSVEFLEHVEEQFLDNIRPVFKACKMVFITHALPGQHGYHHVNCRKSGYWIDVFTDWGFAYDEKMSVRLRNASTMNERYARKTGMFFEAE